MRVVWKREVVLSNKRRGVSLAEVLMAIVIIIAMAGAIVAMMSSFSPRQTLETSVANLLGDLRETQQFARIQRDGYKYYGLRFYDNLGENGDRQGWKTVCYCQTNANGNCTGQITLPITDATTFRVIKSSQASDNNGNGPELLDNTFFGNGVSLDASSEFQISPTPPKLHSIIFIPEGSATKNGVDLLDSNTDEIKLNIGGKIKTISIIPLTGYVKIE